MPSAPRIVIVDDEADLASSCQRLLDGKGYRTAVAHSGEEGIATVRQDESDLVLTDLKMPGMGGMELLKQIKSESPETVVVMMTAFSTIEDAVEAMRLGAADFIPKPFTPEHLSIVVERVLEESELRKENRSLREQLGREYSFDNIIGRSPPMVQIFELIKKIADSTISVLITGASGTGKELIARSIHTNSFRHGKPFVPITAERCRRIWWRARSSATKKGRSPAASAAIKSGNRTSASSAPPTRIWITPSKRVTSARICFTESIPSPSICHL